MNDFALTNLALGLFGLFALWWWAFPSLRRDRMIFDVQQIRDEFFDYVYKHQFCFEDPAVERNLRFLNYLVESSYTINSLVVLNWIKWSLRVPNSQGLLPTQSEELQQQIVRSAQQAGDRIFDFAFRESLWGQVLLRVAFRCYFRPLLKAVAVAPESIEKNHLPTPDFQHHWFNILRGLKSKTSGN